MKVLDHGFVLLEDSMGSDLTVVNAARVSYGKRKTQLDDSDTKLINYLAANQHWSPFRHVQFQFHCKVPEFIARQWYKHVVGIAYCEGGAGTPDHAWNEVSMRYNDASTFDFYIPDGFRKQSESNRQASTEGTVEDHVLYFRDSYQKAIRTSLSAYQALLIGGIAREQARAVLPLAIYTEFYWTCSLQALVNFIKLRRHEGAQWEIQQYAQALETLVQPFVRHSLEALLK